MQSLNLKNKLIQIINATDENSLRTLIDFALFLKEKNSPESAVESSLSTNQNKELIKREIRHVNGESAS